MSYDQNTNIGIKKEVSQNDYFENNIPLAIVPSTSYVNAEVDKKTYQDCTYNNVISPYFMDLQHANHHEYKNEQNLMLPSQYFPVLSSPFQNNCMLGMQSPYQSNFYNQFEKANVNIAQNSSSKSRKSGDQNKPSKKSPKQKNSSPRKRVDRFDGISEEEVSQKFLPDHLDHNLDILIIGINPGLYAAHKGHHYAGPGNHFWKCLYMSELTPEQFTAYDDFRMLEYGIGFTNIVARTTRGSADLSRKEIEEGAKILVTKLQYYKPKIAVFNGKGIYEIYSRKKDFFFGKQPEKVDGTDTYIWVMPSSSARCSQLPRAVDKVPFYVALRKFRDFLKGLNPTLTEDEVVFKILKLKAIKPSPKEEAP